MRCRRDLLREAGRAPLDGTMRYPLQRIVTAVLGGCLLALAAGGSLLAPIATPTDATPEQQPSLGATPAVLTPAPRALVSSMTAEPAAVQSPPMPSPLIPDRTPPTPGLPFSREHGAQSPPPTPHSPSGASSATGNGQDDRPPARATAAPLVPDTAGSPAVPILHRVEAGDTVYQLAARYGASWQAILQANGLDEQGARYLDIGQELVIPIGLTAGGGNASALQVVHQVQAGEALSIIAQDYGTTIEAIATANGLGDTELILAGQELIIPLPPGRSAPPLAATESSLPDVGTSEAGMPLSPAELVTGTASIEQPPPADGLAASEALTDTVQAEAGPTAEVVALEVAMVAAVNAEREARGLPAYRVDETLAAVARAHAQDMVARDYVGHTSPEGKRVRDRLRDVGLNLDRAGENYYVTTRPAEEAVSITLAWFMGDPSHRDNVLHDHYTRIGVGVAYRPPGWYIFVLDFAGD